MKIWVDADACPRAIKEIIFRASERLGIETILVANQAMHLPRSTHIRLMVVPKGPDVADQKIIDLVEKADLVITQDIPLAAAIVEKGATGINPRGEAYTEESVRERLSMRDFMDELRQSGVQTGGPAAFSEKDKRKFASTFDRLLARR